MKTTRVFAFWLVCVISIFSNGAYADDWGCEVLLCLSNPAGPMAVSQCEPPIKKLYDQLSKKPPGAFPTCDMAKNKSSGNSWAEPGYDWFDACPAGTNQLPSGEMAIQGDAAMLKRGKPVDTTQVVIGLDEVTSSSESASSGANTTRKICGGNQVGTIVVTEGQGDTATSYNVNVYRQIAVVDRAKTPRLIKVFIDDRLYRTVRW